MLRRASLEALQAARTHSASEMQSEGKFPLTGSASLSVSFTPGGTQSNVGNYKLGTDSLSCSMFSDSDWVSLH